MHLIKECIYTLLIVTVSNASLSTGLIYLKSNKRPSILVPAITTQIRFNRFLIIIFKETGITTTLFEIACGV